MEVFSGGQIGAQLNILRSDSTAIQSTDPSMAPLAKLQQQLQRLHQLVLFVVTDKPDCLPSGV